MDKEAQKFQRYLKYFVLKQEDIDQYLSEAEQEKLKDLAVNIAMGRISKRKEENTYIVVNEDEPYAEDVWMLIESGKSLKQLGYRQLLKDKPLLLSEKALSDAKKGYTAIIQSHPSVYPQDVAIAQAQREADIKHYEYESVAKGDKNEG